MSHFASPKARIAFRTRSVVLAASATLGLTGSASAQGPAFHPPQHLPIQPQTSQVIVADFNGDGQPDLASVSTAAPIVTIQLNTGGSFTSPPIDFVIPPSGGVQNGFLPASLIANDFDADGDVDLHVFGAGFGPGVVGGQRLDLRNNGAAGFSPRSARTLGPGFFAEPGRAAAVDFDGVPPLDLLVAGASGDWLAQITDAVNPMYPSSFGMLGSSGLVTDVIPLFTGPGSPQLGAILQEDQLSIGGFDPVLSRVNLGPALTDPPAQFQGVASGPFDANFQFGVALAARTSGEIVFFPPSPQPPISVPGGLTALTSADLDQDGDIDLAAATDSPPQITLLLNDGAGAFAAQPPIPMSGPAVKLLRADLNADGRPDLIAVLSSTDQLALVLSNVAPTNPPTVTTQPASFSGCFADGAPFPIYNVPIVFEVGASGMQLSYVWRFEGVPLSNGPQPSGAIASGADTSRLQLNSASFFADQGTYDCVISNALGSVTSAPATLTLASIRGDNNGDCVVDFRDGVPLFGLPVDVPGSGAVSVTVGNFDLDGDDDFALAYPDDNKVVVFLSSGNASIAQPPISVGGRPVWITSADFEPDGDLDLAVANYQSRSVTILLNDGHGNFSSRVEVPMAPFIAGGHAATPLSVAMGDIDGDGDADLAVGSDEQGIPLNFRVGTHVYRNDGGGAFSLRDYFFSYTTRVVKLIDLNRDLRLDLIAGGQGFDPVGARAFGDVYFNDGTGGFNNTLRASVDNVGLDGFAAYIDDVTVGNFDFDSDIDVFFLSKGYNTILPFRNDGAVFTSLPRINFTSSARPMGLAMVNIDQTVEGGFSVFRQDLCVSVSNGAGVNALQFFQSLPGDTFAAPISVPAGGAIGALAIGDFNRNCSFDFVGVRPGSAGADAEVFHVGPGPAIAPALTSQPMDVTLCAPGRAAFSVTVQGGFVPSYFWQARIGNAGPFVFLSDGFVPGLGTVTGARSATLSIDGVIASATLRVFGLNGCLATGYSSRTAALTFGGPTCCRADFNADGVLDPDDLADFIACYFSQPCAQADFNNDGFIDPDDLADFIGDFFAGC